MRPPYVIWSVSMAIDIITGYIRSWTGSGSQSDPSVPEPIIKYGNSSMTRVSIIRLCCCGRFIGWLTGSLAQKRNSPFVHEQFVMTLEGMSQ